MVPLTPLHGFSRHAFQIKNKEREYFGTLGSQTCAKVKKRAASWRIAALSWRWRRCAMRKRCELLALLEQLQNILCIGVGDGERLDAKLLLCLQGFEARGFLVHVCINQLADTGIDRIHQ